MNRFPALSLILKYGAPGSVLVAVAAAALVAALVGPALGWAVAVVAALGIAAVVYIFTKGFVEIVTILTEMLVPP